MQRCRHFPDLSFSVSNFHKRRAPRVLSVIFCPAMSLSQALRLARTELAGLSGTSRLQRFAQIFRLFASEIAGTVALAPFGLKAQQLYSRLPAPPASKGSQTEDEDVYVVKKIYYGSRPRNTVDLYLPGEACQGRQQQQHPQLPVVLFVHGGVWAAGESWHYAPLAASLARLGVITCVMQYTLYPDALVPQLVQEVSAAFDWAVENVDRYGGDASQVTLMGHSAGAQLCMMALLQRAQAAHAAAVADSKQQPSGGVKQQQPTARQLPQTMLMPFQFVGVTGVYDISKHYAYEKDRGVHSLSTMLPAIGGFRHFAANSPSVILAAALQQQLASRQDLHLPAPHLKAAASQAQSMQQQQQQQVQQASHADTNEILQQQHQVRQQPSACDFYSSFPLNGEAISHRIGFDRGSAHYAAAEVGLAFQACFGMEDVPDFAVDAAAFLPPVVLLSSCTDLTVPWFESAELFWRLYDCGVPVKHLVYNKVGHGDFVTEWPDSFPKTSTTRDDNHSRTSQGNVTTPLAAGSSSSSSSRGKDIKQQLQSAYLEALSPHCRDLAVVLMGRQPIQFVTKPNFISSSSSSSTAQQHVQRGRVVESGRLDLTVAHNPLRSGIGELN